MSIKLNIPNILSLYRIFIFPVLLLLIYSGHEKMFVLFISLNFITDVLDGFIARRFNMRTETGAKLDSIADIGTYIAAFYGVFEFRMDFVREHAFGLAAFVSLYILSFLVTIIRFGRICGLHLYSFKLTGYLQAAFLVTLFYYGSVEWFYYLMITAGCWANIEEMIIFLMLKEPQTDVKGLYWILKNK